MSGRVGLGWHHAFQRRQQVLGLTDLLLERRQRGLVGGDQAAHAQHVRIGSGAGADLRFGGVKLLVLQLDQLLGRANLCRVGGARDAGVDDICGQRQVGRLARVTLVVGLGPQTFHRPALTTEHVERVADGAAQCNQIEDRAGRLRALLQRRGALSAARPVRPRFAGRTRHNRRAGCPDSDASWPRPPGGSDCWRLPAGPPRPAALT